MVIPPLQDGFLPLAWYFEDFRTGSQSEKA
jgi:hypothetical protein